MVHEFEELGLTANESKVYEVLVQFGKLGASELSAKSGVPYGRIYALLESLISKGFVETIPEKTKKFATTSPSSFLKIIDEKQKSLDAIKNKVIELEKFYQKREAPPVVLAEGVRGFTEIVRQMKESKKYSYTIKWNSDYKPEWIENTKNSIKRGIDLKTLVRYDTETKKNVDEWDKIVKIKPRAMDNEGFACSVIDDNEVLLGLIKSNITLLIRDKAFAKVMKKLFLAYYEKAEKIG